MQNDIVFPFSVDDKESNSSAGDGKTKTSSSNNLSSKNVNSESTNIITDKNNTSKSTTATNSDQSVANNTESVSEQNKCSQSGKTNSCDTAADSNINSTEIKIEIKPDPDNSTIKVTKTNNVQMALGSNLLPLHATNAKHPVSICIYFFIKK